MPVTVMRAWGRTAGASIPAAPKIISDSLAKSLARTPCPGVIFLWALDTPPVEELTPANLNAAQFTGCGSALYLTQALVAAGVAQPPGLWLVTRGAQAVISSAGEPLAVAQAALWGLGR